MATVEPATDDLIAEGVLAVYREDGFTKINSDGDEVIDTGKLAKGAFKIVRTVKVETAEERDQKGLARGAFTKRLFGSFEWAEYDATDEVQYGVRKQLETDAWSAVNPNYSGRVAKMVNGAGLILVKARAEQNDEIVEVVYVTDVEELLFSDFTKPLRQTVNRATTKYSNNLGMIATVLPHLAARSQRELNTGLTASANLAKKALEEKTASSKDAEQA